MSEQSSPANYQVVQSSQNPSQNSISQEYIKGQIENKISGIHKKIINKFGKRQMSRLKTKSTTQKSQNQKIDMKSEPNEIFFTSLLQKLTLVETQLLQDQIFEIRVGEKLNAIINKILSFCNRKTVAKNSYIEKSQQSSADQLNNSIKVLFKVLNELPFMINYSENAQQLENFDIANALNFKNQNSNINTWQTEVVLQKFINQNEELRAQNEKLKIRIKEFEEKNLEYFDRIYKMGQSSPYFSRMNESQQIKQKHFPYSQYNNNPLPQTTTSLKQAQTQTQNQNQFQIQKIVQKYQNKIFQLQKKLTQKNIKIKEMDYQFKNEIQKYNSVFRNLQNQINILKRQLGYRQDFIDLDQDQNFYCNRKRCNFQKQKMQEIIADLNQQIKRFQFQKQKDFKIISEIQRNMQKMSRYNINHSQSYNNSRNQYQSSQFYEYQNECPYMQREQMFEYGQGQFDQTFVHTSNLNYDKNSRIKTNNFHKENENYPVGSRIYQKNKRPQDRVPNSFRSYSLIEKSNSINSRKPPSTKTYLNNNRNPRINQRSQSRHHERLSQMKKSLLNNKFTERRPQQIQRQKTFKMKYNKK